MKSISHHHWASPNAAALILVPELNCRLQRLRAEHHSRRDTVTMLNNVARSLVSLVRGSGIRKDYNVDDSHEIGRGRFGIVLHAQRIADGESVAIKKIAKRGRSSKAMDNIRNEIEVMKKVKHPHCIPLYNVYESANHIYIVMELVRGGELLDRIINKEHYTEFEAAKCFIQIMSAIEVCYVDHYSMIKCK